MSSPQFRLATAVSLVGLAAHYAFAAEYPSEQGYLQEFPVVLSASRLSQPLSEAPNAVTVIDREMIRASGFRNIADVFRLVPGMFVGYENGHAPIIAEHGSFDQYSRQMQVLVDGRSVYLPPYSKVDWEDIPLHIDDIERIEVVRGPAAASYGANSFQGVINIITRDSSSVNGATVSAAKGNGGIADAAVHFGKAGGALDYRVTLGYRADHGFDTPVLNDDSATRLANLRANYRPGLADSVDIQLGYSDGVRGEGIAGRTGDPFLDARTYSNFEQISWLHALPEYDELKLTYYHIHRRSYDNSLSPSDDIMADRQELELQHTVHIGPRNRLVWGGGKRIDWTEAPYQLDGPQSLVQSRLFAHDEWRMTNSAVLNVGTMLENDGMEHRNTSPRASLNYHLTPQHTLRAGTSVAYRSPAILEEKIDIPLQYHALGGLRPERIYSKEIGYLGEFDNSRFTVDARAYYDQVSDIIYYDPSPLAPPSFDGKPYSFRNLMGATYKGFEGTAKQKWDSGSLTLSYARQMVTCSVTGTLREPLFMPQLLAIADSCSVMAPRHSASILVAQQVMDGTQLSAGYYYRGALQFVNTPLPLTPVHRLDLRAAQSFGKPHESGSGEVALVIQDALRDDYTEFADVPQTRGQIIFHRRAFVTASLNF